LPDHLEAAADILQKAIATWEFVDAEPSGARTHFDAALRRLSALSAESGTDKGQLERAAADCSDAANMFESAAARSGHAVRNIEIELCIDPLAEMIIATGTHRSSGGGISLGAKPGPE
jgi:hypothetical protein